MVQRTPQRSKQDDRAFPVRVRVCNPVGDALDLRLTEAEAWLVENVGRGEFAAHGQAAQGLHAIGFYFRTVEAAALFRQAFPAFNLEDGTGALQHLEAARRWKPRPYEGHAIRNVRKGG
jgi:hypothetical protein